MSTVPTGPAVQPYSRALLRGRRRAAGIVAFVCALGAVLSLALSAPDAHAATRHRARVSAQQTLSRLAVARVTKTATATATVSVDGFTATATGHGRATVRIVATATATASATAAVPAARSMSPATARAHAQQHARSLAGRRAAGAARILAYRRALARAGSLALQRATVRAQHAATEAATLAARRRAKGGTTGTGSTTTPGGATSTGGSTQPTQPTQPTVAACGGEAVQKADGTSWVCTFDDEFDGTGLDGSKWIAQQTANSSFAPGTVCYIDSPSTVSEGGGHLNLTVNRTAPFTCPSPSGAFTTTYTGGTVSTFGRFSQTYGRFEIRAKLPAATAAGLQETLWLWPDNQFTYGAWPDSGEIDLAEFYSQYAGWNIPYIHYAFDPNTSSWQTNTNVVTAWPAPYNQPGMSCRIDQSGFNTYTLTWLPGQLTIAVNGQNCLIDNYSATGLTAPAPFDQPFFVALTQALGVGSNAPTANTPLPATTQVDYVRVWK